MVLKFPTVYSTKLVALDANLPSPSARKPLELSRLLKTSAIPIRWVAAKPVSIDAIKAVHDPTMVDDILACRAANGFGTISPRIAGTLPYTSGAMLQACLLARPAMPAAALVSGFHHAEYGVAQMYCTFNGLMVAAVQLLARKVVHKIAIIDGDYHYGNGTDDILDRLHLRSQVWHYSFGKTFYQREQAKAYIRTTYELADSLRHFGPALIIYQAGADVHCDDPLGGVLTDEEIQLRDSIIFSMARDMKVPLAWDLAGGYRVSADGDMTPVLQTHVNTFRAAMAVYLPGG
jgi:acetoin utilization deacetylase AcuC-like enzyme